MCSGLMRGREAAELGKSIRHNGQEHFKKKEEYDELFGEKPQAVGKESELGLLYMLNYWLMLDEN